MKKIFSVLALVSLCTVLALPVLAQTAPATGCTINRDIKLSDAYTCGKPTCSYVEGIATYNVNCGVCCMLNTVYNITDWIFFVLLAIAVLFIIVGGFMFITSGGSPEKTMSARNYLIYAAIGIVVGL